LVFALVYLVLRRLVLVVGLSDDLSADVELIVLRHQLKVLKRRVEGLVFAAVTGCSWRRSAGALPRARWSSFLVSPQTLWGSKTLCGTVAACPSTAHSSNSSSSRGDSPASTTTVWSSNEHHSLSISSDRSRGHSAGSVYHPLRSSSKSSW